MSHEIKTESIACSLCNSKKTKCKAKFNGKEYKMVVKCLNKNCVSNNLQNDLYK